MLEGKRLAEIIFTIHFATINTTGKTLADEELANLQYTLLLLIPVDIAKLFNKSFVFTIHFATINTRFRK